MNDHVFLTLAGPLSGSTFMKGQDEECGEESHPLSVIILSPPGPNGGEAGTEHLR